MLTFVALLATALAAEPPNLVLITMDTTRADALGCYGSDLPGLLAPRTGVSPVLDGLAAEGVRFEHFFAHAPTTLNSHTSLLTGLDPHGHAVPRNGYPLPEGLLTLAERLQDEGYDTAAVVAAAALDADMGLSRGFRLYDDQMSTKLGPMYQDLAAGVLRRTKLTLDRRQTDAPLFLWVHFYDPHGPYAAPEPWLNRFALDSYTGPYRDPDTPLALRPALRAGEADPADIDQIAARYLGEVHYMDHHIGLLLEELDQRDLLDNTWVVATADHGETLSELPALAYSHGGGVDDGVLHIPLIVSSRTLPLARGAVVQSQLDTSGLAPTLESLLGLEPTLSPERNFAHFVRPGPVWDADGWPARPTRVSFSEATRTRTDPPTGWNNAHLAHGVRAGDVALLPGSPADGVSAVGDRPKPSDSDRLRSLLGDLLRSWNRRAPPHRERQMSDETLDALRALGYIETSDDAAGDEPASTER